MKGWSVKSSNNYTVVLDFRVNGEKHSVEVDPDAPLLWVLCVDVGGAAGLVQPSPQPPAMAQASSCRQAVITS
jgi:hypothetical protein